MVWQSLRRSKEAFVSKGMVTYSESLRAWAVIRFKKEFVRDFPLLKQRASRLNYEVSYYENYKQMEKILRKMKREKKAPPLLLIIEKD